MAQGREPVFMALNRGLDGYPIANHTAIFERQPILSDYNAYITNYQLKSTQMEAFDKSKNTVIQYEDLRGEMQMNIGPVVGALSPEASVQPSSIQPTVVTESPTNAVTPSPRIDKNGEL